ncbi:MAG: HAMP domain-containing sensor histidine kinase [Bacteroidota bacterium]
MDIYTRKSRWKIYLAIGGALIVGLSVLFTTHLANKLREEERKKVESWQIAVEKMTAPIDEEDLANDQCDITLHLKILESNTTIPAILVNDRGNIDFAVNFTEEGSTDYDSQFPDDFKQNLPLLEQELDDMKSEGRMPIEGDSISIWYQDSTLLTLIKYFPFVQVTLIAAFILFGYIGLSSARKAEQNQVWVGMAKETAHQLGTPISAILAWIEHLKIMKADDEETQEIVKELTNDVMRLDLVADRFSKIGSAPTLESINIYEELEKCRSYMEKRASRKVVFEFPEPDQTPIMVNINPHLFDWVVENLLRNALDAMAGKGTISAVVSQEKNFVNIDISDSGKGIPTSKFKTVFQPGYTTKKRGWGLGLSLAKRIIESYHSGKIFVKKSVINEGTTFSIKLPIG